MAKMAVTRMMETNLLRTSFPNPISRTDPGDFDFDDDGFDDDGFDDDDFDKNYIDQDDGNRTSLPNPISRTDPGVGK